MRNSQISVPKGIIAASPTPMMKDHTVDHGMLVDHCRWLLSHGCSGIAALGSTGEANSFSVMERLEIMEKLLLGGIAAEKLLAGTGCCAVPDTVLLTKHALSLGVYAVLLLPPFYYKNVGEDGLFNYYADLINKVNDDRLRIILYHNPKMSGVPITHGVIERLVRAYPGIVVGMKDSGGDWNSMQNNCVQFPDFKIYSGSEAYLLDIIRSGGAGCISATINVTSMSAMQVLEKRNSVEALSLQEKLSEIRDLFERYPLIAGVKCILAKISNNPRWLNMRPPLMELANEDAHALTRSVMSQMQSDLGVKE